jgi:hypothetical protein
MGDPRDLINLKRIKYLRHIPGLGLLIVTALRRGPRAPRRALGDETRVLAHHRDRKGLPAVTAGAEPVQQEYRRATAGCARMIAS